MTQEEAINTAKHLARSSSCSHVVGYDAGLPALDWRDRYFVKRFGFQIFTGDKSIRFVVSPDGTIAPITWE